ncbi:reverse transcriptase domain-containing protein, partial [Tanacetum coccineum]
NGDGNGNGNGNSNGNGTGNGNNGGDNGNGNENRNVNRRGDRPVARECTYQDFMKCQPLSFKGTEGVVGLIRWSEKMEIVFHISNCSERYQVKYVTCTLLDNALTWWNSNKRTIRTNAAYALSWRELLKLMKNSDMATYTQRFQELTLMCTKMVPEEEDRVEKFIGGLPDNIQGNMITAEPTRLQDVVRIANHLMDTKLKGYAIRNTKNKRSLDNNYRGNRGQQPPHKRHNTGGVSYTRKDSILLSVITVRGLDIWPGIAGHYRKDCPKVKNQNRRNKARVPDARGKAYVLGGGDANSGSNTVTGLLGHPFNIDLMPIDLDSFDVIIGMDWLAKNHAVIVCDKKIVRIPYENEILIVTVNENKDESKEKRLETCRLPRKNMMHPSALGGLILELLKKEELYAKFSKCDFWLSKVQFLGHVIDSEAIHVDPAKIESIKDWKSPKNPTEIRQFS